MVKKCSSDQKLQHVPNWEHWPKRLIKVKSMNNALVTFIVSSHDETRESNFGVNELCTRYIPNGSFFDIHDIDLE